MRKEYIPSLKNKRGGAKIKVDMQKIERTRRAKQSSINWDKILMKSEVSVMIDWIASMFMKSDVHVLLWEPLAF